MSAAETQDKRYLVSVAEEEAETGSLVFTFVPNGVENERGRGSAFKRGPQFSAAVREEGGNLSVDWRSSPDDPAGARSELEAEIAARMQDRAAWIARVSTLVDHVERWAREMGWSTRRLEKKLEDARVGPHRLPALLLQEGTCRVLLEPVGRSAPGADGMVDLYLMPAYDDIASLYYYGNQWNVHYVFPGTKPVATVREAEAMPLSKEAVAKVLADMRQHAA
jgi:hypothetical protein